MFEPTSSSSTIINTHTSRFLVLHTLVEHSRTKSSESFSQVLIGIHDNHVFVYLLVILRQIRLPGLLGMVTSLWLMVRLRLRHICLEMLLQYVH